MAVEDGRVVGFRSFMRWQHETPDGEVLLTVRTVDTATRPSRQGRGIFRRLTLQALDDLHADGVALVFNTPNDKSRPGYVKMGWTPVGRLGTAVRMASPKSLMRVARARVPADIWSVPSDGGSPAADVLSGPGMDDLLRSLTRGRGYGPDALPPTFGGATASAPSRTARAPSGET